MSPGVCLKRTGLVFFTILEYMTSPIAVRDLRPLKCTTLPRTNPPRALCIIIFISDFIAMYHLVKWELGIEKALVILFFFYRKFGSMY